MAERVNITEMADAIQEGLLEYSHLAANTMKDCVKQASTVVKKEIKANAPVKTGQYQKSWKVSKQRETSTSLHMAVHSKNRHQLAHLLEKGHVKRGGGRVQEFPHIAPAEEKGRQKLTEGLQRGLQR
ncbi:HK97 gp10 family phage protein [Anaeromicropila populeti]|uniref:Bacteriophage HK97-gp10, putative tail-component n=1 Tax=Anaeromicropila populeti TaxID=37658 RepID=A0A1I6LRH7_9FIRM|nr:HK97 gp10 family phage protein [Anaeromicropila populeti]SFS05999.1 Bacteriophage HK97-gp10, putative tail-component [Anaeromicropila populeti]